MPAVGMLRKEPGVHYFEVPVPKLSKPKDVLVRIRENGICGTDTHMAKYDYKDIAPQRKEIILGHEMMGVVEKAGKGVKGLKPGDAVTMTVRRPCGLCAPCASERSDYCLTGSFNERGIHKLDGFLTKYVVDDEKWVVKIPPGLEKYGVIAEPLGVVAKALEQVRFVQSRIPKSGWLQEGWGKGKRGAVLGVGSIGFLAAAAMREAGMEVTVISRSSRGDERVKMVEKLGCEYASTREKSAEEIGAELSGKYRLDLVFEAAGAADLAFKIIPFVSRGGAAVLTGIPRGELRLSLDSVDKPGQGHQYLDANFLMRQATRHNLAIVGSVNCNRSHFEQALALIPRINEEFKNILDGFVTMRVPLKQYQKAFEAEKIMKAVVQTS